MKCWCTLGIHQGLQQNPVRRLMSSSCPCPWEHGKQPLSGTEKPYPSTFARLSRWGSIFQPPSSSVFFWGGEGVGRDKIGVWTQGFTVAKQTLYHLNHTSSPSLFSVLSRLIEDISSDQSQWDSSFSSILLEPFLDYININSKSRITTPFLAYFLLRIIIHTHTYTLHICFMTCFSHLNLCPFCLFLDNGDLD
jgi:hypothetical protein